MSDSMDELTALQALAAALRVDMAASCQALQAKLEPRSLMKAAKESLTEKASASLDPAITSVLSAHGTSLLALGVAALGFGLGHRAFAKAPAIKEAAIATDRSRDRIADMLALAREANRLIAMLALVLAPDPKHDI